MGHSKIIKIKFESLKPRNLIAKGMQTSGAGEHRKSKRAVRRGLARQLKNMVARGRCDDV